MPRKKTIQPEPIETFNLDDGTIVEIRDAGDEKRWEIKRGAHNERAYVQNRDKMLDKCVDHYLTPLGRKPVKDDFLKSPSEFARKAQLWGFGDIDDGQLRNKYHPDILKQIRIFEEGIENNKKGS